MAHRLSCSEVRGIFPDQGSKPVSPALVSRFFTTEPPGKRLRCYFELPSPLILFQPKRLPFSILLTSREQSHVRHCTLPGMLLPRHPLGSLPCFMGFSDKMSLGSPFLIILPKYDPSYSLTLEKAMAPHSSTLAWKIPWTEEPGRLQSMGSLGVGHD